MPARTVTTWTLEMTTRPELAATLPEGVVGPFFNDEFGDTFGNIYALTGPGFDYAILKDYAERRLD